MKIQTRLILPIALILSATWIGAAVFTKKAAFKKSRQFLVEETKTVADTLIAVLPGNALSGVHLKGRENEMLAVWMNDELLFSKGQMLLGKPSENLDVVQKISGDNWVFSSRCAQDLCLTIGTRDTDRKYAVRWLLVSIYLPLFFIFAIGLIAAIAAVKTALRPLNALTEQVNAADLDKLEKLPDQNVDQELQPLVHAINTLIENLKAQLEKERGFLNTYAHEIRTPIAGLVSQMQSLDDLDQATQDKLANVRSCADRTVRVANQFLALAKSKNTAALKTNDERFDICEVIRQTAAEVIGPHGDIDLQMAGDTSLTVSADMFAIEVIFRNLLDNAKWYGNPETAIGQKILITCGQREDAITVCIEDNGAGLSNDQMHRVTEEFYRAETAVIENELERPNNDAVNPDGAGLGLSIVKAMVHLYDGQLELKRSDHLGGLAVCVSLPVK